MIFEEIGNFYGGLLKENIISFYRAGEVCKMIEEYQYQKNPKYIYKCEYNFEEFKCMETEKTYKRFSFKLRTCGKYTKWQYSWSHYGILTKTYVLKDIDGTIRTFPKIYTHLRVSNNDIRECLNLGYKTDHDYATDQEIVIERDVDKIIEKLNKSYEKGFIYESEYKETLRLIRENRLRSLLF